MTKSMASWMRPGGVIAIVVAALAGCNPLSRQAGVVMAPHLPRTDGDIADGARLEVHVGIADATGTTGDSGDATALARTMGGVSLRVGHESMEIGATLELAGRPAARFIGGGVARNLPTSGVAAPTLNFRVRLHRRDTFQLLVVSDLGLVAVPLLVDNMARTNLEPVGRIGLTPSKQLGVATLFATIGVATSQTVPAEINSFEVSDVVTSAAFGLEAGVSAKVTKRLHLDARGGVLVGFTATYPQLSVGLGVDL